jgi:hypothetical protein
MIAILDAPGVRRDMFKRPDGSINAASGFKLQIERGPGE